ncbi:hypothetical protein Pan216_37070 [Planctomycetes bacterium Pan216]|uniref:Uncharacterized protein n=1 Tax=Kolteria novifilia TaxID=2527975 RepID=A0A518B784_9BACT|nr:hypothetical protein Pan216_37070 [Planctomycetes bacterium Pan216]
MATTSPAPSPKLSPVIRLEEFAERAFADKLPEDAKNVEWGCWTEDDGSVAVSVSYHMNGRDIDDRVIGSLPGDFDWYYIDGIPDFGRALNKASFVGPREAIREIREKFEKFEAAWADLRALLRPIRD